MQHMLTRNWLLSDLMPNEVDQLVKAVAVTNVSPGQMIIEKGKPNDSLWIVAEGKLGIQIKDKSGKDVIVAELSEGECVGEMSWLDGHPASASTVAMGPVRVLRIRFADFEKFLGAHSEAHIQILRKFAINLSHRLRG